MSCSSSNAAAVIFTFLLTAIFSSLLTIVLILLYRYLYIKSIRPTRKEPVKPVEQDSYEEVQTPDVINPGLPASNPVYDLVDQ